MDDNVEDGELVDSDGDEDKISTDVPAPSPDIVTSTMSSYRSSMFQSNAPVPNIGSNGPPNTLATFQLKPAARLRRNSSDSDSSIDGQGHSSDSECENGPAEKRKFSGAGFNAALPPMEHSAGDKIWNVPAAGAVSKSAKKYNIWGNVLEEQTLSKDLSGWFGLNKKVESDRDVESYDYIKAKSLRQASIDNEDGTTDLQNGLSTPQPDTDSQFDPPAVDICDVETFGTDSQKPQTKRGNRPDENVLRDNCGMSDEAADCRKKLMRKRRFNDCNKPPPPASNFNGTVPNYDKCKDRSHVNVNVTDSTTAVARELMRVLGEPDHMTDTFVRVVDTLGAQKSLEILYATEDLEAAGGMMTLDGTRRRTPGGIYLYLLKGDPSITKSNIKQIFIDRYETQKRDRRAMKQRLWQQRVTTMDVEVAAVASQHLVAADPTLPGCKEAFLSGKLDRAECGEAFHGEKLDRGDVRDDFLKASASTEACIADDNDLQQDEAEALNIELDVG